MLGEVSDHPGLVIAGGANFESDSGFPGSCNHMRIFDNPHPMSNAVGLEQIDRLGDIFRWTPLTGMNRGFQSSLAGLAENWFEGCCRKVSFIPCQVESNDARVNAVCSFLGDTSSKFNTFMTVYAGQQTGLDPVFVLGFFYPLNNPIHNLAKLEASCLAECGGCEAQFNIADIISHRVGDRFFGNAPDDLG